MKKTFYILTAVLFIALYSYASNMDYEYAADIRRETGYIVSDRLVATNDGNLWEFDTERMEEIYAQVPYEEIREDLKATPKWIREIILQMQGRSNKKFNKYEGRRKRIYA